MNAQHRRHRLRLAALAILWVVGLYLLLKPFPSDQLVHFLQKFLAAGLAPFVVVLSFREGQLIRELVSSTGFSYFIKLGDLFRGSLYSWLQLQTLVWARPTFGNLASFKKLYIV
jgi:hypothetical protein